MATPPKPRYGIAEWYGLDIAKMSSADRHLFGQVAAQQEAIGNAPDCPFLSTLIPEAKCNKSGGVCSIRRFTHDGRLVADDKIVTVCPSRFLERTDGLSVFVEVSKKVLGVANPIIVKETPFLRKVSSDGEDDDGKRAGRIDWILVDPATLKASELSWCAVETQALYFSGGKMLDEFEAYAKHPKPPLLFPVGKRRPDYRSSGPKRLAPQLDVKVPVLRSWGKKVVVIIDQFFFESMNTLADAYPKAKNDNERRDAAEVIWFVVDYSGNLKLRESATVYSTLDSSRVALNATEPLSKVDFTANLRAVIQDEARVNKVFRV